MEGKTASSISRRRLVGGVATLAAASLASSTAKGNETMASQELTNPTDKYPKPPFKKQSQPWPGLAGKMEPPPDHGEKSYRGSGRLAGRKALITGGDSGMGRAAGDQSLPAGEPTRPAIGGLAVIRTRIHLARQARPWLFDERVGRLGIFTGRILHRLRRAGIHFALPLHTCLLSKRGRNRGCR